MSISEAVAISALEGATPSVHSGLIRRMTSESESGQAAPGQRAPRGLGDRGDKPLWPQSVSPQPAIVRPSAETPVADTRNQPDRSMPAASRTTYSGSITHSSRQMKTVESQPAAETSRASLANWPPDRSPSPISPPLGPQRNASNPSVDSPFRPRFGRRRRGPAQCSRPCPAKGRSGRRETFPRGARRGDRPARHDPGRPSRRR